MAEKKSRGKIASAVEAMVRPVVEENGYFLWDVDYYKEGADYNLLITIENFDRTKPIDLEDCEKISRIISPLLDENDPTDDSYYLEVSSAGLERELVRPEHFSYYLGTPVELKLYSPVDGKKQYRGILEQRNESEIHLRVDEKTMIFQNEAVAKVSTVDESL